jgi:HD-like signal output (HDOD) protein
MTAKILQLVNSAFFGLPRQITNPADAVAYLGLATVRALAFSAEIFSRFDPDQCRLFRLETLERHSWNTGLLARRIAHLEKQNNLVLDSCFLAGLMHDIGQLVFATSLGDQYNLVIARAGEKSQPLCIIEQEVFGASHAEVGAYLLGLWGLPNPILEAVAWHHAPEKNPSPQFSAVLAVHVADVLIHEKQVAYTEVPPPNLALDCLDRAGLSHRLPEWRAASLDHDNQ